MKTATSTILALLAALPLCGCAKDATTTTETGDATMNSNSKAFVTYFSATGTTKGVDERLAAAIGKAKVVEGKRFSAFVSAEDLKKWAACD